MVDTKQSELIYFTCGSVSQERYLCSYNRSSFFVHVQMPKIKSALHTNLHDSILVHERDCSGACGNGDNVIFIQALRRRLVNVSYPAWRCAGPTLLLKGGVFLVVHTHLHALCCLDSEGKMCVGKFEWPSFPMKMKLCNIWAKQFSSQIQVRRTLLPQGTLKNLSKSFSEFSRPMFWKHQKLRRAKLVHNLGHVAVLARVYLQSVRELRFFCDTFQLKQWLGITHFCNLGSCVVRINPNQPNHAEKTTPF